MSTPDIRISDAAARSAHSLRSAVPEEHPMDDFVPPELPSPASSYFPPYQSVPTSPSPITPSVTLSTPSPDARPPSSDSFASLEVLGSRGSLHSPSATTQDDTVLGGPLTPDPEPIVAGPDASTEGHAAAATPIIRRRVCMAPSPVALFTEGETSRYRRQAVRDNDGFTTIPSLSDLPFRGKPGGRWESFVHPEGNRYFRYKNFFTNENLYDSSEDYGKLYYVERTMERILEELSQYPSICLEDVEVGIGLMTDEEGDELGCHYFVNTKTQEVFYLDDVDEAFFFPLYGTKILSREHLSEYSLYKAAESLYWDHVFMFPHRRILPLDVFRDLLGELLWLLYDRETSIASTSPYAADELYRFQAIMRDCETDGEHEVLAQHMTIFSRMRSAILTSSFRRYHGEYCAQLDSYLSQHGEYPEPARLFKIIAWLFFFTPRTYLHRVRRAWVDHQVNPQQWRTLINELQRDWEAATTPATVILTTNVGFLAIQSVDLNGSSNSPVPDRSVAQILAYMSTVLSIGNIVACMILARHHRPSGHVFTTEAANYLASRAFTHQGMEKLAIVYAIPTAFFLWALLTFFLAICWVCFNNTNAVTRCIVGATVVMTALMLGVYTGSWSGDPTSPTVTVNDLKERIDQTKALVKNAKRMPRKLSKRIHRFTSDTLSVIKAKTSPEPGSAQLMEGRNLFTRPSWMRSRSRTLGADEAGVA